MSNWKVVFDEVILDINKYLGRVVLGQDYIVIILSSNPKF
jgi:hypothetical protein